MRRTEKHNAYTIEISTPPALLSYRKEHGFRFMSREKGNCCQRNISPSIYHPKNQNVMTNVPHLFAEPKAQNTTSFAKRKIESYVLQSTNKAQMTLICLLNPDLLAFPWSHQKGPEQHS